MRPFTTTLAACVLSMANMVDAAPITYNFTASVTNVLGATSVFPGVAPGQVITGSYTFESTAADEDPANPTVGAYRAFGAPYGIRFTLNGVTFASDASAVYILDNYNSGLVDGYTAFSPTGMSTVPPGVAPTPRSSVQLSLATRNTNQYLSDALDPTLPDLASFEAESIESVSFVDLFGELGNVRATLTSISSPAAVPEPAILGLLAVGVCGLLRRAARARRAL